MNRSILLSAAVLALLPAAASAQPKILVGAGISSPGGDLADVAEPGYHGEVGIELPIPTLPVALRATGDYHRFAGASAGVDRATALGGNVNVVFSLPGVGLGPYILVGVGRYRLEGGLEAAGTAANETGFQGAFGVNFGDVGFVELRYVQINGVAGDTRYVPVTVGLRM